MKELLNRFNLLMKNSTSEQIDLFVRHYESDERLRFHEKKLRIIEEGSYDYYRIKHCQWTFMFSTLKSVFYDRSTKRFVIFEHEFPSRLYRKIFLFILKINPPRSSKELIETIRKYQLKGTLSSLRLSEIKEDDYVLHVLAMIK